MTAFLLSLTALLSYILGCASGCTILSRRVFRRAAKRHTRAESPLKDFYQDFGVAGCAMLVVFDILKSVLAVSLGSWLMGFVGQAFIGKIFAAFCLLLGQCFPLIFYFKGGMGLLPAGVALFMIDWRIGLGCWVICIVVVIFTRYRALGAVLAAVMAPIFTLIFDLDYDGAVWLPSLLVLLCSGIIIFRQMGSLLRIFNGTEPRAFEYPSEKEEAERAERAERESHDSSEFY